ncbi:MAG: type II toxin-antitoxin system Phd/YefM family antitoxin [Gemmatimonadota bacterium]
MGGGHQSRVRRADDAASGLTLRRELHYNDHMVIQMTATEVKRRILSLLDQVAEGDEIEITKHGRTVAKLVPATGPAVAAGAFEGIASSDPDDDLLSTGLDWKLP